MFYPSLATLHERCVQLTTKVYALSFELAQNDEWHVVLTSISGASIGEVMMPFHGPLNAGKLLPQPFYRRAADGNLYTFQEFLAYYGEERSHSLWALAAPCYDHMIVIVHEA